MIFIIAQSNLIEAYVEYIIIVIEVGNRDLSDLIKTITLPGLSFARKIKIPFLSFSLITSTRSFPSSNSIFALTDLNGTSYPSALTGIAFITAVDL